MTYQLNLADIAEFLRELELGMEDLPFEADRMSDPYRWGLRKIIEYRLRNSNPEPSLPPETRACHPELLPRRRKPRGSVALLIEATINSLIQERDWTVCTKSELLKRARVNRSSGHKAFREHVSLRVNFARYCKLRSGGRGPKLQ